MVRNVDFPATVLIRERLDFVGSVGAWLTGRRKVVSRGRDKERRQNKERSQNVRYRTRSHQAGIRFFAELS
jgi:hypothetical protein